MKYKRKQEMDYYIYVYPTGKNGFGYGVQKKVSRSSIDYIPADIFKVQTVSVLSRAEALKEARDLMREIKPAIMKKRAEREKWNKKYAEKFNLHYRSK